MPALLNAVRTADGSCTPAKANPAIEDAPANTTKAKPTTARLNVRNPRR
jgi:hypothetical protein